MDNVLSIVELVVYIVAILAISMAATWLVIKISPSESAKEQRERQKQRAESSQS